MTDVFLSYASQDRQRIVSLVEALQSDGLAVWWDRDIQAGSAYDREIESAIAAARCVVVVWSNHSVDSEYVRSEAEEGARRNVLVPALIDDVLPPLAHRRRQAAILTAWTGARTDAEYCKLLDGIRTACGRASESPRVRPFGNGSRLRPRLGIAAVLVAALAGIGVYFRESILLFGLLNAPAVFFGDPIEQELGFATAADGTRIAYAVSGAGPAIVQVLSIGTHLENGQYSPVYDNDGLIRLSSHDNLFVRYDGRGSGLSDREVTDFSIDARVSDIEAVVDALGLERFGLLAVSAGGQAAIAYTARHPDRVTGLVLAGALAFYGDAVFSDEVLELIEAGWQRPEVAGLFADALLSPEGDATTRRFVSEMFRRAGDGRQVAAFYRESAKIDVRAEASTIVVPTLVMIARGDEIVPLESAREQAAMIPGARLEILEGGHMASSASTAASRMRALEFLADGR